MKFWMKKATLPSGVNKFESKMVFQRRIQGFLGLNSLLIEPCAVILLPMSYSDLVDGPGLQILVFGYPLAPDQRTGGRLLFNALPALGLFWLSVLLAWGSKRAHLLCCVWAPREMCHQNGLTVLWQSPRPSQCPPPFATGGFGLVGGLNGLGTRSGFGWA